VFGCGHVLDQKGPEGQLARAGPDKGIPTVEPELGGSVGFDQESIEIGVEGVFNVLKHYEFLPGHVRTESQTRASGFEQYGAPTGGLVDFKVELGERVTRNQTLFEVTDVFGDRKTTVSADSKGIFWRTRRLPQVATGEYVCSVGTDIDTY
jgi:predicted deacylase